MASYGLRVGFAAGIALYIIRVGLSRLAATTVTPWLVDRRRKGFRTAPAKRIARSKDPIGAARAAVAENAGGGAFVGLSDNRGSLVTANREHAVLVIGPPRSGKTTSIVVPTVLSAPGAVVSTATKLDVMRLTASARRRTGTVWLFDPTGHEGNVAGTRALRWTPVTSASGWDSALLMARAMVKSASVGSGTSNESHWAERAVSLLAPLLRAAHVDYRDVSDVVRWVLRHELDEPMRILGGTADSPLAENALVSIMQTHERERSSILSTTSNALTAFNSEGALANAVAPNFDATEFAKSGDTVYVTAPAHLQALVAPIVVGLLEEIRQAAYAVHRSGELDDHVVFALDEIANIAPLPSLPSMASEAGGQGLHVVACLQDLSQARARWGWEAQGFLTLFGTKVVLPGVGDRETLETLSTMFGRWDRPYESHSMTVGADSTSSHSSSVHSEPVLDPGQIAGIPDGRALLAVGSTWRTVTLTPCFSADPWQRMLGTQ